MQNNVVFLDCTQNYGYNFSAGNTKVMYLAKGLIENGDICTVHNGIVGSRVVNNRTIIKDSEIGDIITYRLFVNQLVSWFVNLFFLIKDLYKYKKKTCNNIIINDGADFHIFVIYIIVSRILGYKWCSIVHEWGPVCEGIAKIRRPSVWLYSKTFGYFANYLLPISEYLINKTKHFNRPFLKVPVLAGFEKEPKTNNQRSPYFLYCASAIYYRVLEPFMDAHHEYVTKYNGHDKLVFVLSGIDRHIEKVKRYIKDNGYENDVVVLQKLPFSELIEKYTNAKALIIPLDPKSEQDEARFSQKIAEYCSVGSPILTTDVGEVHYYFEDGKNAIFSEYSVKSLAQNMAWISNNPDKCNSIGYNGYLVGKENFDYHKVCEKLHCFLLINYNKS